MQILRAVYGSQFNLQPGCNIPHTESLVLGGRSKQFQSQIWTKFSPPDQKSDGNEFRTLCAKNVRSWAAINQTFGHFAPGKGSKIHPSPDDT